MVVCCAVALLFAVPQMQAAQASSPAGSAQTPALARMQGKSQSAILNWVLAHSGPLTGEAFAGAYRVAYTITPPEGWWALDGQGKLAWHEPPASSVHLRVFVADRSDGRLMSGLTLSAAMIDAQGNEQPAPIAFGWYPLINAYGGNVPLLSDGSYRLRVSIVAPVARTTPVEEAKLSETPARITQVEFRPVEIEQNKVRLQPLATETPYATAAQLLKPCNDALGQALTALWQQSATGAEKPGGDYFIAYALGDSAVGGPLSALRKGLDFGAPANAPLEILVRDSRTGRPIPGLTLHVQLISSGSVVDAGELTPLRRPWLNVYGISLRMEHKSSYRLRVRFQPPQFRRWGRQSNRFALPGQVEFDDVSLQGEANPKSESKPKSDY